MHQLTKSCADFTSSFIQCNKWSRKKKVTDSGQSHGFSHQVDLSFVKAF
jgi:hypothetical protein